MNEEGDEYENKAVMAIYVSRHERVAKGTDQKARMQKKEANERAGSWVNEQQLGGN